MAKKQGDNAAAAALVVGPIVGTVVMMLWVSYTIILNIVTGSIYCTDLSEEPLARCPGFYAYIWEVIKQGQFWKIVGVALIGATQGLSLLRSPYDYSIPSERLGAAVARVYSVLAGSALLVTYVLNNIDGWRGSQAVKQMFVESTNIHLWNAMVTQIFIIYVAVGLYVISTLVSLYLVVTIPRIYSSRRQDEGGVAYNRWNEDVDTA